MRSSITPGSTSSHPPVKLQPWWWWIWWRQALSLLSSLVDAWESEREGESKSGREGSLVEKPTSTLLFVLVEFKPRTNVPGLNFMDARALFVPVCNVNRD
jgi:hypothetical protein